MTIIRNQLGTLLLLAVLTTSPLPAQDQLTEHTLRLNDGAQPAMATIDDIAWLAGSYRGDGLGGVVEEIWSEPRAGMMVGLFRATKNDTLMFTELMYISEEDSSLVLRLKHFNPDLTGWEEKNEVEEFHLVKMTDDAIYFDGLTIRTRDNGGMEAYVNARKSDGTLSEFGFVYDRVGQ
ncbi:MAG: hypothetical protein GF341_05780 [candidate division Zixibacteria bacterium]|nr:hypothetical protein [candidate division Zixibacteria bacterium]